MKAASEALTEGDNSLAEQKLLEAQALFPERAGAGSTYRRLASLYRRRDENDLAIQQLVSNINIDADDLDAHLQLVDLYQRNSDQPALAAILERILYIQPFETLDNGNRRASSCYEHSKSPHYMMKHWNSY